LDLLSQNTLDVAAQNRLITTSITQLQQANPDSRIILILDNPDVLLATASTNTITLNATIMNLRSLAHTTILTAAADLPLISATAPSGSIHVGQATPLEFDCASFIAFQAHNARVVMSARELATGAAKDISGVLRVTRGGDAYNLDAESSSEIREAELQYLVQRDGIVKVFSRGADVN
jgi:elongator complex protein 6